MNANRRFLIGFVAALLALTAVLTAFLIPPSKPDLMTRSTKIVDLTGIDEFWFYWLDDHRLLGTRGCTSRNPAVVRIDVNAKTITPLNRVNASLHNVIVTYSDIGIADSVPSPDQQWILFCFFPNHKSTFDPCLIRVRDGRIIMARKTLFGYPVCWLTDSRHWAEIDMNAIIVRSLSNPAAERVITAPGIWDGFQQHLDIEKINRMLGNERVVTSKRYQPGGTWNDYGIISPDGTHIAWLRQSDSLAWTPHWLKSAVSAYGYESHMSGEIWTTRLDGTDRQEIGQFGNQPPPPPRAEIDYFDWTPDGKRLIFDRGRVLYSVPVPESPAQ